MAEQSGTSRTARVIRLLDDRTAQAIGALYTDHVRTDLGTPSGAILSRIPPMLLDEGFLMVYGPFRGRATTLEAGSIEQEAWRYSVLEVEWCKSL